MAASTSSESRNEIQFQCTACQMTETCEYKGPAPPFVKHIKFTEDVYAMRDPFCPPPTGYESRKSLSEYYLVLGADCAACGRVVCKAAECSFFYAKTFCLRCAGERVKEFPLEVQSKVRKQILNAQK